MPTTTQPNAPEYSISGQVVDRATQRGVRGARVEAWDRDTRYHDLLGQVTTDENGRFSIGYGSVYFGDFAPDVAPDLYFKVQLDNREVLNTFEQPRMNTGRGLTTVKLEIDLPQLQPLGTDVLSPEQTVRFVDWWRASDFKGLWRNSTGKANTVAAAAGPKVALRFKRWDFEPVRNSSAPEAAIVSQPLAQAQQALAAQQVQVTDVRPADASAGATLRSLANYPLTVGKGDKVTLYTENGVVKYYTRSPETAASADVQAVARLDEEVQALKASSLQLEAVRSDLGELKQARSAIDERASADAAARAAQAEELKALREAMVTLRQSAAEKDVQIAHLHTELLEVRTAADRMITTVPLSRLEALERRLGAVSPALPVLPVAAPRAPRKAATATPAAAKKAPAAAKKKAPAPAPTPPKRGRSAKR